MNADLYAVLGVLPDALPVVVTAAYRALAQLYHPDRSNDPEAHRRMAEINRVYAILGNADERARYDREQSENAPFSSDESRYSEAFSSALSEVEDRWQVACTIFPDLIEMRNELTIISTSLAFAFVTTLLETKNFSGRAILALHLENMFLERYFGTNPEILNYARRLIFAGKKTAAKALNGFIEVVGSDVDAALLIQRIDEEHGLELFWASKRAMEDRRVRISQLSLSLRDFPTFFAAKELGELLGFEIESIDRGFFSSMEIVARHPTKGTATFKNQGLFTNWAQQNFRASK